MFSILWACSIVYSLLLAPDAFSFYLVFLLFGVSGFSGTFVYLDIFNGWLELLFLFIWDKNWRLPSTKWGCLNTWSVVPFLLDLWKSYMFSYLIKDEKLLCLKYWGRIWSPNEAAFLIMKPSPSGSHQPTIWSIDLLSTIS